MLRELEAYDQPGCTLFDRRGPPDNLQPEVSATLSQRIDVAGRSDAIEVWPRRRLYPLARLLTEALSPFTVVAVLLTVVALLTDPHWVRSAVITVVPVAAVAAVVLPAMLQSWVVLVLAVLGWVGVTWSRVYLDRHQVSDVVLGSILGGLVGVFFLVLA